jgi:4-hydroxy-tetrahydrodipicolinate synthase
MHKRTKSDRESRKSWFFYTIFPWRLMKAIHSNDKGVESAMVTSISNGVWPTMLTPFTLTGQVDYAAFEQLIEWYIDGGVSGLFTLCHSSEMIHLTQEERVEVARFVKEKAAGRVQVIASGNVPEGQQELQEQIDELKRIAATGVDAVVLISNRFAQESESDEVWKRNAQKLLNAVPNVPLGIYESPFPYKRLFSTELLKWCAETGRFLFLKDTCCDLQQIKDKLDVVAGSELKIFNANSATMLESLKMGVAGFSGIMANFHPDLYAWLIKNWDREPGLAIELQAFMGVTSLIELQEYPVNAKYHLQQLGLAITTYCRSKDAALFKRNRCIEVEQLEQLSEMMRQKLKVTYSIRRDEINNG